MGAARTILSGRQLALALAVLGVLGGLAAAALISAATGPATEADGRAATAETCGARAAAPAAQPDGEHLLARECGA